MSRTERAVSMKSTAQLREALALAEKAERQENEASRKVQYEAWKVIRDNADNWEWLVQPVGYDCHWPSKVITQGARISKRMKADVLEAWKADGLPTFSESTQDGCWHGMFYYRTAESILTHAGGGHLVLNDPMLCNDAEWQAILDGNIPQKYKR